MHEGTLSKIFVALYMISMFSAINASSNSYIVGAQPVTLEEILAAINALNERLDDIEATSASLNSALSSLITAVDNMQSQLDSLSATTATKVEVAILDSALDALDSVLDALNNAVNNLGADFASLNATIASRSDLGVAVDELSTALDEVKASLSSFGNEVATSNELDAATSNLSGDIEILNKLIIVGIAVALMAAVASIAGVYYLLHSDRTIPIREKPPTSYLHLINFFLS